MAAQPLADLYRPTPIVLGDALRVTVEQQLHIGHEWLRAIVDAQLGWMAGCDPRFDVDAPQICRGTYLVSPRGLVGASRLDGSQK